MTQKQSTLVTLGGYACVVPDANRFPQVARLANSYWCPLGPAVGRAWVLLPRRDVDELNSQSGPFHELMFESRRGNKSVGKTAFPKMLLVQSRRLTAGAANDENSLHLVELADRRLLVERFSDTGSQHFNIRSFAQANDYLDGTSGFTWTSTASAIWNTMSSVLGGFPGLPAGYTPHGTPENLHFIGVNAWQSLNQLLYKISCTTAYDPIGDTFSIVLLGSQQANLPESIADGQLLLDAEPQEENATRFPATIRVYFHTHYRSFGQERDTETTDNWIVNDHNQSVDVATGIASAQPGTVLALWDDLPRVLDEDNAAENSVDLTARANQRASNWISEQQTSNRRRLEIFPRIVDDVLPGSQIKAVLWRAWGPQTGGTATEIATHPGLPAKVTGGETLDAGVVWDKQTYSGENFAPPDLARHSTPNYPRLANIVQAYDPAKAAGATLNANADGLHPGRLRRWVAGGMATLDDCWLLFVDDFDANAGNVDAVNFDFYGPGRLCGVETSDGSTKPIYLCRRGVTSASSSTSTSTPYYGVARENWSHGGGSACDYIRVYHCDDCEGTDTDFNISRTVYFAVTNPSNYASRNRDPNAVADQIIKHSEMPDGSFATDSYMDDLIGTIKEFNDTPAGWTAKQVSGWELVSWLDNVFTRGTNSELAAGTYGGSDTATVPAHTSAEVAASLANHTDDVGSTSLNVADHDYHYHYFALPPDSTGLTGGAVQNPSVLSGCTSGPRDSECGSDVVLDHTVNPDPHSHTLNLAHRGSGTDLSHTSISTVPYHYHLLKIMRIDNSVR